MLRPPRKANAEMRRVLNKALKMEAHSPFCELYRYIYIDGFISCHPKRRPVSSVGRVPDSRAGGRGFKPRQDQHSGSLITEEKVLPL